MKAGRPGTSLPSPMTVSRDIKAAFERCQECIDTILKVSPLHLVGGHLLNVCNITLWSCISTDVLTSPNHHAFVVLEIRTIVGSY